MFSTHHTCHGKKYIALCVYSDIEPGSRMARAPTRRSEAVGAPKCSIPVKIWLEVTVLKGHCHGYLKCVQYTSDLQNFLKSCLCKNLSKYNGFHFYKYDLESLYMSNRKCRCQNLFFFSVKCDTVPFTAQSIAAVAMVIYFCF